jgi:hydroxymethylpyrimidine/phosphomethylpyrimidine kinase
VTITGSAASEASAAVAAAAVLTAAAPFAASESAAGEACVEGASTACALAPKSRVEPAIRVAAFLYERIRELDFNRDTWTAPDASNCEYLPSYRY